MCSRFKETAGYVDETGVFLHRNYTASLAGSGHCGILQRTHLGFGLLVPICKELGFGAVVPGIRIWYEVPRRGEIEFGHQCQAVKVQDFVWSSQLFSLGFVSSTQLKEA